MSVDTQKHPHLAKDYYSNGQVPGPGGLPLDDAPKTGYALYEVEYPETPVVAPPAPVAEVEDEEVEEPEPLTNRELSDRLTAAGVEHRANANKATLLELAEQAGLVDAAGQPVEAVASPDEA